jgi:putative membrane protein insertion efficiency factor
MTSVRRALWLAGAPVRTLLLGAIGAYRATVSKAMGNRCRFSPSCSAYASEAIRTHGALVGTALAVRRVLRCNPFGGNGLDPVPARRRAYDGAIRTPRRTHAG